MIELSENLIKGQQNQQLFAGVSSIVVAEEITVVSRFSGLRPSISKGPLNRDSPLNGIIPNQNLQSKETSYYIFKGF